MCRPIPTLILHRHSLFDSDIVVVVHAVAAIVVVVAEEAAEVLVLEEYLQFASWKQ